MSWVCYRKATQEDKGELEQRARAFIARHNLGAEPEIAIEAELSRERGVEENYYSALEDYLHFMKQSYHPNRDHALYLGQLWRRIVRRVLDGGEGIAYGYVGRSES